jgi:aspartate kinase
VTNIRNTNIPDDDGTRIVSDESLYERTNIITGIAGRKNFTVISIGKAMMNQEIGYARRILAVLEENEISFEHMPSGIDTLSIIIDNNQLDGKLDNVLSGINANCAPDTIEASPGMAMIAVVGRAMSHTPGVAANIFTALYKAGINIRMVNQGSSEMNIIVGVENSDYENAIRAIYRAFVE